MEHMTTETASNASQPLAGKKILITRPRERASRFAVLLREYGAEPIEMPTIQIEPPSSWEPLDRAIAAIGSYAWLVFTSATGVQAFFARFAQQQRQLAELQGLRICAIGPETAKGIQQQGLAVDVMPAEYRAEAMVEALACFPLQGKRVLLPRAAVAREVLPQALETLGAQVDVVEAYRTGPGHASVGLEVQRLLEGREIAAVTFTSASTVANFATLLGEADLPRLLRGVVVACIGPITAEAASSHGLAPEISPTEYTVAALARAIAEYFSGDRAG
jgi:uroporphyrinogen III methyltransferase/synthase